MTIYGTFDLTIYAGCRSFSFLHMLYDFSIMTLALRYAVHLSALLTWAALLLACRPIHDNLVPSLVPTIRDSAGLGKALFNDKALSRDGTISCANCHIETLAFTDGVNRAVGYQGQTGTRNTPSLLNAAYHNSFLWDGRKDTLEDQVLEPFLNPREHALTDMTDLLGRIRTNPAYRTAFKTSFGTPEINPKSIAAALAEYVRSLSPQTTPYDRFVNGDASALSSSAKRGLALFTGTAGCSSCHLVGSRRATFTDDAFHSIAIGLSSMAPRLASLASAIQNATVAKRTELIVEDAEISALGRYVHTGDPSDIGKFRTPSLWNVAITGPYMHDGSVPTLDQAVARELYYRTQSVRGAGSLTPQDKNDIVTFLQGLTSDSLQNISQTLRPRTTTQ
jgi:cytochrome c peroxidase